MHDIQVNIDYALGIAAVAHLGQLDKQGRPYIEHIRKVVARALDIAGPGDPAFRESVGVVAALHDVLEDTNVTSATLIAPLGILHSDWAAIHKLTRDPDETYSEYIGNLTEQPLDSIRRVALTVKLADLEANLSDLPSSETSLRKRYMKAREKVWQALEELNDRS